MAAQKVRLLTLLAFLTFRSCDSFRADVQKIVSDMQVEKEHYCPPGYCFDTEDETCFDTDGEKVQVLSYSPDMENAEELREEIDEQSLQIAKPCTPGSPAVQGGSVQEMEDEEDEPPVSPAATDLQEEMDTMDAESLDSADEVSSQSQSSPSSGAKGKKITIEGFPEDIDGVHRGVLNGVYYQALGDHCVQGKPTYWRKLIHGSEEYDYLKNPDQDLPFLYFCKKNSTNQAIHRKWAISRAADFAKIKAGKCETFAPFPARTELAVGVGPTGVHLGWKDGKDLGFAEPENYSWVNDVKITAVEDMDESPTIDCSAGEAPELDATGPPRS